MMRSLARMEGGFFASPAWLASCGSPRSFSDVDVDQLVIHGAWYRSGIPLQNLRTGETVDIVGTPGVVTNDIGQVMQFTLEGVGVGGFPTFVARPWIDRGDLVPVLEDWGLLSGRLAVLWPAARHVAPRVRAFIDHAVEYVALSPDCPPDP